jgi:hypothetical protein
MNAGNRKSPHGRTRLVAMLLAALALFGVAAAALYWVNNGPADMPSQEAFRLGRDRARDWLRAHESEVLAAENPALWWMVKESAAVSGDAYLGDLYARYYQRYLATRPGNVWHHLFDDDAQLRIQLAGLEDWSDYNLLFLYGLSCQADLRNDPRVTQMLNVDYCGTFGSPAYFRDPACATHQLMGLRFAQRRNCGNPERMAGLVGELAERIAINTTWDFRVVDFYLQRSLMLTESGAVGRIKPRWLVRILEAQRPDGGWDDFQHIVGLPLVGSIGWAGRGIRLREPTANFHTTAQGLYLMSLLASGPAKSQ